MEKLEWFTVQMKAKDLLPTDFNPRKITEERKEKLKRSLAKFNLVEIPVVNFDNSLIAGHQRIKALAVLDRADDLIDVRKPNRQLTTAEHKEYMIISNTHAGEFDWDILEQHFSDLDFDDIGFDLPDFGDFDPSVIIEGEDDGYVIPDEIKTDIIPGDYFEIGPHRLLCAYATLLDTWERLCRIGDLTHHLFDLVVTDPPYNVDYTGGTSSQMKIMNDKMDSRKFYSFLFDFFSSVGQYLKFGGAPTFSMRIPKVTISGRPLSMPVINYPDAWCGLRMR